MLTRLDIQGLAIIDSLSIEFSSGFNVITGETGAGKSILIKALSLLLGSKSSSETVRRGKEAATVTGSFEVPAGHKSHMYLQDLGIPVPLEGDNEQVINIIIRRTLTNKGRSTAWINDTPVTIAFLRELAPCLIDVFGQHDNLRILDASQHIHYVDLFLKNPNLLNAYQEAYQSTQSVLSEIESLLEALASRQRDADYLEFRCSELNKFGPSSEDYDKVRNLSQKATVSLQLMQGLERVQNVIDQGAGGEPISTLFWDAARIVGKLESLSPLIPPISEQISDIAHKVDDLSFHLGKAIQGVELDESTLEEAQSRLAGYQEIFRKMSVSDIESMLQEASRLHSELALLETAGTQLLSLLEKLREKANYTYSLAEQLSRARIRARELVKDRMTVELRELAMPDASIDIEFIKVMRTIPQSVTSKINNECLPLWKEISIQLEQITESGMERAQFLLAANKGEAMLPLHKFASGGEISRIMLAIKKALAAGAESCVLVFDEIDSGISGRVANVVGKKMQDLSKNFQVICISHLAQVAAHADTHFLVHKFGKGNRTESTITPLNPTDSARELARLLSGEDITDVSLENAKVLIGKARKKAGHSDLGA